jgi:hypothetical protein
VPLLLPFLYPIDIELTELAIFVRIARLHK